MFKQQSEARGELTTLTDEMLGNMKVVQAFGYEKEAENVFRRLTAGWPDAALRPPSFLPLPIRPPVLLTAWSMRRLGLPEPGE